MNEGTATITVKTEDGDFTDACVITVEAKIINVTGVTLDKTSIEITEEDTEQLTATVSPNDATDKSVIWSSENDNIATVTQDGLITAIAVGTTNIVVTTNDGSYTDSCSVTVNAKVINVTGVSLNKNSLELVEEDTETLTATVSPDDATNKNVIWSTENSGIATVSEGVVTAVSAGNTTITVTTEDGSYTDNCSVIVTAKIINVESVSLDKTSITLTEEDTEQLTATVSPENATDTSVTWSTENSSIATVSQDGLVTAVGAGTTTVTVTTTDGGKTATCNVTVNAKVINVESVTLNKNATTLTEEDTEQLTYTISPDNATDQSVTWSSNDTGVATVVDGLITAVSAGTANITVTTTDGSKTDTCVVTVNAKTVSVDSVSLNKNTLELEEGASETLIATVSPTNATNQNVTWSAESETIATVSDGLVTAVAEGSTTITVTTEDGGKTDSCSVTVTAVVNDG